MALEIHRQDDAQAKPAKFVPGERLYLTADKQRLVGEGDPEAAFLYCSETGEVDRAEFERLAENSGVPQADAEDDSDSETTEKEQTSGKQDKDKSKSRATKSKGGDE